MSLIKIKKCEFDIKHVNQTVCSECGHISEGLFDACPECNSTSVKCKYSVSLYSIKDELEDIYINKDHIVKAQQLSEYNENYYLLSFTNGGTLIVNETDFNSIK